jgi:hypothetical protein
MLIHNNKRYIPMKEWNDHHEYPKYWNLRYYISRRKQLGIEDAVKKIGSRMFIDEDKFFELFLQDKFANCSQTLRIEE